MKLTRPLEALAVVAVTPREETSEEATRLAMTSVEESDSTRLPAASRSSTDTVFAKFTPATALAGAVTTLMEATSPAST